MMIGLGGERLDVFHAVLLVLTLLWISGQYKWRQHGILPPTIGGGVSPCTESAVRLLIGHGSVVGLTKVLRRRMHLGYVSSWGFSCFSHLCGCPGGLLLKGGMM